MFSKLSHRHFLTAAPYMRFKTSAPRKRKIRAFSHEKADALIGQIEAGFELFCLNAGQVDVAEILEHIAWQTGPASLTISTWTAAGADISRMRELCDGRLFTQIRWLLDRSFPNRQPEFFAHINRLFPNAIRLTAVHSKFAIIRNDRWNIVCRGSANLNSAKRLEHLEISDDAALADAIESYVDDIFKTESSGEVPLPAMQDDAPVNDDALHAL
jgi:hypothetical protein